MSGEEHGGWRTSASSFARSMFMKSVEFLKGGFFCLYYINNMKINGRKVNMNACWWRNEAGSLFFFFLYKLLGEYSIIRKKLWSK